MWFPQNPKVLVVDDRYNDVKLLLKTFMSKGISHIYFEVERDENDDSVSPMYTFPETPLTGIRLVVLDIELDGITNLSVDVNSIGSSLVKHLCKLMDVKESSYAILFWTKRSDVIASVLKYLKVVGGEPIAWFDMEKPAPEQLDLKYVTEKFFSDLHDNAFEFLLTWEDSISKNAAEFVNRISKIVKQESNVNHMNWNGAMKEVLSKLAASYLGVKKIDQPELKDSLKYATEILNQSFLEEIKIDESIQLELPPKSNLSLDTIAILNAFLFVEQIDDEIIENGKIFYPPKTPLYETLKKNIIEKKDPQKWETSFIGVILTPSCDLAHGKFLIDEQGLELHRVLYGLKIIVKDSADECFEHNASIRSSKKKLQLLAEFDTEISKSLKTWVESNEIKLPLGTENKSLNGMAEKIRTLGDLKKKIMRCISGNKPDCLYITEPFMDENKKIAVFVFHFGTLRMEPLDPKKIHFAYLMKNDLIADLQTKAANHVNRLGHSMLEY